MHTHIYADTIQRLFLTYLGYPADSPSVMNWGSVLNAWQGDTRLAIQAFSIAPNSIIQFLNSYSDTASQIDYIFKKLFEREAGNQEVILWQQRLETQLVDINSLPWVIQAVAQDRDAEVWQKRLDTAHSENFMVEKLEPKQFLEQTDLQLPDWLNENTQYSPVQSIMTDVQLNELVDIEILAQSWPGENWLLGL